MEGVLNVLKPPGMTSHDVVGFLRRRLGIRKVGHTGTLDPLAAGVLVVCVGRATRIAQYIPDDKVYRAELVLGITTTTGDAQGDVQRVEPLPDGLDLERLEEVLAGFAGPGLQVPPMTSARKVKGKKLYELARRGVEVLREARPVMIHRLRLVHTRFERSAHPRALIDVSCSKGTYVRTLCADIGARLGCGAYMSFLVRSAVGPFPITAARTLEELEGSLAGELIAVDTALGHLPAVLVHPGASRAVLSGRALYPPGIAAGPGPKEVNGYVRLRDETGLLAVAKPLGAGESPEPAAFQPVWVRGGA
ncbi:MAG: tRNA pseudouridine(55) synthase TruB [Bacillota bacterium]